MFIYNDEGLPVGYECSAEYPPHIAGQVEAHMLGWYRRLSGQSRRRLGKVGLMEGSSPNLDRLEKE